MANISYKDKSILEELLNMKTGYVLDFYNSTFSAFIGESINIDIYNGEGYQEYSSKASKLRQIFDNEPDNIVGVLIDALMDYCEDFYLKTNELSDYRKKKIGEMRILASNLKGNVLQVNLQVDEDTLKTLLDDINNALSRNKPELVLDRLHTFSTKFIREICEDNNIEIKDEKGNYYPLHSLAGKLKKQYEQEMLFQSTFTALAIQNCISLFDKYNEIRNNHSYAHDNAILNPLEAEFAVKIMADVLLFIDQAEKCRKRMKVKVSTEINKELPF